MPCPSKQRDVVVKEVKSMGDVGAFEDDIPLAIKSRLLLLVEAHQAQLQHHLETDIQKLRDAIEGNGCLGSMDTNGQANGSASPGDLQEYRPSDEPAGKKEEPVQHGFLEGSIAHAVYQRKSEKLLQQKNGIPEPRSTDELALQQSIKNAVNAHVQEAIIILDFYETLNARLDIAMGLVIMSNATVMAVENQYVGYLSSVQLGISEPNGWPMASDFFVGFEHVFAITFIIEFALRLMCLGRIYFRSLANLFDFILVLSSILDLYVLGPLGMDSGPVARTMRGLKLIRILRILRLFRVFTPLRFLVLAMVESTKALFWPMVLLGIVISMGGFAMCQLVVEFVNDEDVDYDVRRWTFHYYGTTSRSVRTMYEATMSGCWPNYTKTLIDKLSSTFFIFWFGYVTLVVFAMIRVITALFIRETLASAASNKEVQAEEAQKKRAANAKKLRDMFTMIDESGDGKISEEEMTHLVQNKEAMTLLRDLDLKAEELMSLFTLLDDGSGEITYEEFIQFIPKLKGNPRGIDIIGLQHQGNKIMTKLNDILQ